MSGSALAGRADVAIWGRWAGGGWLCGFGLIEPLPSVGGFGKQRRPAGVEGQFDLQGGACSWGAVDLEAAAERFGPVFQPDQAGAVDEVRAAAARA